MRFLVVCTALLPLLAAAQFAPHTIANDLKGGYQVVAADVNHDGKLDLLALASGQADLVWYENPTWQRHVIASHQKGMINLAYDRDQIALASEFSNEAKKSVGLVSLLVPQGDPRQPWQVREIDRLPTSHQLRWADLEGHGRKVLMNAPLTGATAEAPEYHGPVPLVLYRPEAWKREVISEANAGVQHGIFIVDWEGKGRDCIVTASFSGIDLYTLRQNGDWQRTEITQGHPGACPRCGSSDVSVGKLGGERFLAAIEPWHGNEMVLYRNSAAGWTRMVLDDSLTEGHTILTADFNGDGRDEIIAGFRGNGGGVLLYQADAMRRWSRSVFDQALAANSCVAADLNGDGRPDVACIGGAALRWYENVR